MTTPMTPQPWSGPQGDPTDTAGWEARLRGLAVAFHDFSNNARRVGAAEQVDAQRTREHEHANARRAANQAMDNLARVMAEALDAAQHAALRRVSQLAGGLAGAPFDDTAQWQAAANLGAAVSQCIRVGTCDDPATHPVPIVVPLLSTSGWLVQADTDSAAALVTAVVLRVVGSAPPSRIRVDSYDPLLTGVLGAFGVIRQHTGDIVPESMTRPGELAHCLDDLVGIVAQRAGKLAQFGCRTFEELLHVSGRVLEQYRLVVLLNYPAGIDEPAQRELLRLVDSAAGRGVCFLVHLNTEIPPNRGVQPTDLLHRLRLLSAHRDQWNIAGLDGIACRAEPGPSSALCTQVSALVGQAAATASLPAVALREVLPPSTDWLQRISHGQHAELRVQIGMDERVPAAITLRSSNPPLPNILIGGAVGQGKSNALLVLIHGLAARYSPDDLQMYLLDFKQGLEFSALGPAPGRAYWLPHVKVLGVYADREFGIAVLRHLIEQLDARSDLFKRLGNVVDIAALPPDNPERPPRILLVLDEFQVMMAEDDDIAVEATELLEKLVRLGRAYGIHVVLATQTLEGIQRLAVKRESIFGQVPYRVILKTTPGDSQAMLATHNTAAAALRFRGQAVLNDNFGAIDSNKEILVAYADQAELDQLRHQLWQRAAAKPPRIFEQAEPADFCFTLDSARSTLRADHDSTPAWVGLPVTVDGHPIQIDMRPEPGAGLLVLGDDAPTALGVLTGVAVSLAIAAHNRGDTFLVLDSLPSDPDITAARDVLIHVLDGLGHTLEVVGRADIPNRLYELRDHTHRRTGTEPPLHVIALGLHRVARLATGIGDTPLDALQEVAAQGANVGVYLYGWWNRLKICTDHLGYSDPIGTRLFLRHPVDGIRGICGVSVNWTSRPHRGLLHDGIASEPRQVVTFAPLTTDDATHILGVRCGE